MGKKMLIDATHAEETRVVVADGQKVDEFDFETIHRRQLAGNIYLAKVTRVEPSLQAAFVDYGGNRHGFLAFAEIHPDYYQIPMADRQALLEEERAYAEAQREDEGGNGEGEKRSRRRSGRKDGKSSVGRGKKGADKPEDKDDFAPVADEGAAADNAEAVTEAAPDTAPDTASENASENGTETSPEANPETGAATGAESESAGASDTAAPADESAADKRQDPMPAPIEGKDPVATKEIGGMDIIDLDDSGAGESVAGETAGEQGVRGDAEEGSNSKPRRTRRPRSRGAKGASARDDDRGEDDAVPGDDNAVNPLDEPEPYRAADHAAEIDDQIESVADEDVSDELRPPRRPRLRRYKIQEVIKVRQIMLVQVVKEERGNKGAALTTYLSLAGRYCVLMPNTARGGGISRKITNAADRKKLKQIAGELEVPQGAGLIIRTAGANRTKAEIRRDYEYLSRLWDQIRDLTLQSIAPAPIYEEGDLIKRSIRDLYSREIDEVLVEGEAGYRAAKAFMKMIMPSHARNVKLYDDPMPLFARYQVESYLAGMFNPTVQLKSGGYIVIGITEALVAIDVNSGKATRQGSIEETALQTNLEAAEEIARQLRLRDLAGLIVIDFIDMEERKNNNAVEKRLKDKLKDDRARIQVGRISGFGLLEMSRQRLRPGMLEATTQPCPHCHGTGLIRSDNSLGLTVLRAIEEEGTRRRSREVLVKAPVGIANYLINDKREHLAQIEARYGMAIRIEADPTLVSPDFTLEKFKTATRIVATVAQPVVSFDAGTMQAVDSAEEEDALAPAPETGSVARAGADGDSDSDSDSDGGGRGRRRRRRRRRGGQKSDERSTEGAALPGDEAAPPQEVDAAESTPEAQTAESEAGEEAAPAKPARRRSRRKPAATETAQETAPDAEDLATVEAAPPAPADETAPATKPAPRRRSRRKADPAPAEAEAESALETAAEAAPGSAEAAGDTLAPAEAETATDPVSAAGPAARPAAAPPQDETPQAEVPQEESPQAETAEDEAPAQDGDRPRRRGWWAFRR